MARGLAVLVLIEIGVAHADSPAEKSHLVQATLVASSTLPGFDGHSFDPANIDEDMTSQWCEGNPRGAVGESISVTFDHPIEIGRIYPITDSVSFVPETKRAQIVELAIELDGKRVPYTSGVLRTEGAAIKSIKLTITKVEGPAGGIACLNRVRLFLPDSTTATYSPYFGELAVLDAFRVQIGELHAALATCNAKQLAATVQFPLERSEWVDNAGGEGGHEKVTKVATATKLAQLCRSQPKRWGKTIVGDGTGGAFRGKETAETGNGTVVWHDARWWLVAIR
jgi:hypothetical protein